MIVVTLTFDHVDDLDGQPLRDGKTVHVSLNDDE